MSTQLEKALGLAWLGLSVFPVYESDTWAGETLHQEKSPRIPNGHLGASGDQEQIKAWWRTPGWESSLIGVNAGMSNVVVLDIDNKDGRDGWFSLTEAGLEYTPTLEYQTRNGGAHAIFRAPDGFSENGTKDHKTPDGVALIGCDRRSGSSYFIYWGDEIPWTLTLAEAPAWLLTPCNVVTGAAFNGTVSDWLESIPHGEPDAQVLAEMARIPLNTDFGHEELLKRQTSAVLLAGEGHPGVGAALELLRSEWLREPYNKPEYIKEYDTALVGAIRRFGGSQVEPTDNTAYRLALENLKHPRAADLLFNAGSGSDRRELESVLLEAEYDADDIFDVVWFAPVRGDIDAASLKAEIAEVSSGSPRKEVAKIHRGTLLTDDERFGLIGKYNFIDQYCAVTSMEQRINEPYHRINALMGLALVFSGRFYIQIDKGVNLNIYTLVIGDSGSGKTESLIDLVEFLKAVGIYEDVNIGGDSTETGLHKTLIERDGLVSWFHSDEADQVLARMMPTKNGQVFGALRAKLTQYYDQGNVDMIHRSGDKEASGRSARTYFNMWLGGTENEITENLNTRMVKSGFVARFITAIGDPKIVSREVMATKVWSAQQRKIETNPHLLDLGTQTREVRNCVIGGSVKTRMGIVPTDGAVARMDDARWTSYELFKSDPLWGLIEPNITRILTIMWKAAGLFALSNGRHVIELEDALFAIREGETWLANSVRLMRGISSNDFTKAVDIVGKHLEEKGSVPKSSLYRWAFNGQGLSQRELDEITQNLLAQGLIREKGVSWVWAD